MASLTPEEYEYAINLDIEKLPNRLRCAVCNKAVVDAMKTECCDTVVCGPCATTLGNTCPVCEYAGTASITREDKRTRTTLKAHIKGELQKRHNAAAAAAAAAAKEAEIPEEATPPVEERINIPAPAAEVSTAAEEAVEVQEAVVDEIAPEGEQDNPSDDKSDIVIITERPEEHTDLQPFHATADQEEEPIQEQENGDIQYQQNQMPFDPQQMFNNMGMNGFNPMLAMQGMNMPFPMMPNMMGMGMDPSMLFGGGFAGMNGMASMMSGNMMNGNFGMPSMGDMNDFNQYNQYGNRFDNRPFQSNRGRGYGQDFRGRGRGFHRGRGRGGWYQQQQYQQYGQQNYDQQQGYQQDNHASDHANDTNQESSHEQHDPVREKMHDNGVQEEQSNPHETHDAAQVHEAALEEQQIDTDVHIPIVAPPVNAPTGPRAMREGLPNSGRYSRPQPQDEAPRPVSKDQAPAPASAPAFNPPKGPSAQRRQDDVRDDTESARPGSSARSRSPKLSSKRHRSRSPRRDYDDEDRYAEDKRRRKRDREYEGREYEKKRSRSGTPDERRHRHRDDKERRREKSRGRGRRSRDRDEDDYERRKPKHKSRREDKYGDDYKEASRARPAEEDNSDDIGFKIKGTSSGKAAPARSDPYAEERERMKEQRLQRDAERRQTSGGKRGRDDNGDEHVGKKRRSRPKAKYEDEIGDHEQERERNRWR